MIHGLFIVRTFENYFKKTYLDSYLYYVWLTESYYDIKMLSLNFDEMINYIFLFQQVLYHIAGIRKISLDLLVWC